MAATTGSDAFSSAILQRLQRRSTGCGGELGDVGAGHEYPAGADDEQSLHFGIGDSTLERAGQANSHRAIDRVDRGIVDLGDADGS